jgi:hypothetical protein
VGEKAGLDHRSRHAKAGRKPLMVNKVLFFGVPNNQQSTINNQQSTIGNRQSAIGNSSSRIPLAPGHGT